MPRLAFVSAIFALLVLATPASAGGRGASTFQGTCELSGRLVQDPPITTVPAPGRAFAAAAGTCSGTLTDARGRSRRLDAARSRYAAAAEGVVGCAGGSATGAGVLIVRGTPIRFRFSELRGPGGAAIRLEGARGGAAVGEANASPSEDPAAIAAACAGPGLRSVAIDITLATAPAISG